MSAELTHGHASHFRVPQSRLQISHRGIQQQLILFKCDGQQHSGHSFRYGAYLESGVQGRTGPCYADVPGVPQIYGGRRYSPPSRTCQTLKFSFQVRIRLMLCLHHTPTSS
jgi:hypothetical protein